MARVSRPDQEKSEQDQAAQPQDPTIAQQALGAADSSGGSGGTTQGETAPAPRARFANLSRILYANQGQGAKMAQGAIGKADQAAADVNSKLGAAQAKYASAAAAATPKPIVSAQTAPPLVKGSGGLTGNVPAPAPQLTGNMFQDLQTLQNTAPAPTTPRTTTQINTAADLGPTQLAQAQQVADTTYQGPHSLVDTLGMGGLSDLQQGLNQAGQQYGALDRNPSQQTGGAGRFNDFLIQAEGTPQIKAAQQRFSGLRDKFNAALGDTSAGDTAAAATQKAASDAKGLVDKSAADTAAGDAQRAATAKAADDAAAAAAQDDAKAYDEWTRMQGPAGEATGMSSREYFEAHKDEIKKKLQDPVNRFFYHTTYGIENSDQLLARAGLNPDGTKKTP